MSYNPDQPRNPDGTWASEGAAVSITGNVEGRGKRGVISQVSPSGKFAGVSTAAGKHLGYYSLSDLSPAKTRVRAKASPDEVARRVAARGAQMRDFSRPKPKR